MIIVMKITGQKAAHLGELLFGDSRKPEKGGLRESQRQACQMAQERLCSADAAGAIKKSNIRYEDGRKQERHNVVADQK